MHWDKFVAQSTEKDSAQSIAHYAAVEHGSTYLTHRNQAHLCVWGTAHLPALVICFVTPHSVLVRVLS